MLPRGNVALLTGAATAIKGELICFGGAAVPLRWGAKVILTNIRPDLRQRAEAPTAEGHGANSMHPDAASARDRTQVLDPPAPLHPNAAVATVAAVAAELREQALAGFRILDKDRAHRAVLRGFENFRLRVGHWIDHVRLAIIVEPE